MKKITSLLVMLVAIVTTAFAQTHPQATISIGASTGTFYDGNNPREVTNGYQYLNKWVSSTTPALTLSCSGGNIVVNNEWPTDTKFNLYTDPQNFTLSYPEGKILSYTIKAYVASNTASINGTAVSSTDANNPTEITVTDINATTATIVIACSQGYPWIYVTEFTVTVENPTPEQAAAKEKENSWLGIMALITDGETNYTSNAQQSNEGSRGALLDQDNATYFHSAWSGGMSGTSGHDLQARLPEAVNEFRLYYVTRNTGTGYPTAFRIDGSNNAGDFTSAGGTGWTESVASLSSLPSGASVAYWSDAITMSDAYQYLRFVPTIGNNNNKNWFCLAEFWILKSSEEGDAAIEFLQSATGQKRAYDLTDEEIAQINQIDEALRSTTADITYVVKDENGNPLFTSDPVTVAKGSTITTLPEAFQHPLFYTYNEVNMTITGNTDVVFTATLKEDALFKPSTVASPVWYTLEFTATNNIPTYTPNDTNANVTIPTAVADDKTTQHWSFVGDPYNGFKMMNKAAGDLVLGSAATTHGQNDNGGNVLASLATEGTHAMELWFPESSSYKTNGFYLRNKNGHALNKRNNYPNNITYWTGGADAGSTFAATIVLEGEDLYRQLLELLENTNFGTAPNTYTLGGDFESYANNIEGLIADIENTYGNAGNFVEGAAYIQQALDAIVLNLPKAGFYRIKGKTSGKYLANGQIESGNHNFTMSDATDKSTIFCFDGTKLVNYETGMANGMNASTWAWVYGDGTVSTVEFQDGETGGGYRIKSTNAYFFDGGTSADRGGSYDNRAQYHSWYLEEVTTLPVKMNTVDDKSYATFSAPVGITGVEGATIYSITIDGNQAVYTEIEGGQAPAETGLLLIGEAGTTEATITIGEVDATVETEMKPQIVCIEAATAKEENKLFLGTKSGKLGFYNLKSDGGKSGGFKAYIQNTASAPASGEAKGFELVADNEATGIDSIHNSLTIDNGDIYNLQGQKVNKAQKGVFIQNGKKVVVK